MRTTPKLILVMMLAALGACGERTSSGADGQGGLEEASRALVPADTQLAELYNRSCRSCHTVAATGAPLTGDVPAWDTRLEKGADVLLENVINGFGGMPPFGMCMDCDADQFDALIQFMAKGE